MRQRRSAVGGFCNIVKATIQRRNLFRVSRCVRCVNGDNREQIIEITRDSTGKSAD